MALGRFFLAPSGVFCALIAAAHCGGTVATSPADGGPGAPADASEGVDVSVSVFEAGAPDGWAGSASGDAATEHPDACSQLVCPSPDAAPPPLAVCPAAPPTIGSPCPVEKEECEYGASFWLGCNALFQCKSGAWAPAQTFQPCAGGADAGVCPATFAEASAVDAGVGMCPADSCQYPDGYCTCLAGCSGGEIRAQDVGGVWTCIAATATCPSPRPDLGTACDSPGAYCQYGLGCGCGEQLQCVGTVWQGNATPECL